MASENVLKLCGRLASVTWLASHVQLGTYLTGLARVLLGSSGSRNDYIREGATVIPILGTGRRSPCIRLDHFRLLSILTLCW